MDEKEMMAELVLMKKALLKTPHSNGDHTDRCRMDNQEEMIISNEKCKCHVGLVRQTLDGDNESVDGIVTLLNRLSRCDSTEDVEAHWSEIQSGLKLWKAES